jgi:hypothetical protein
MLGYDLSDYDRLFEEKLELLTLLLTEQPVTWSGTLRAPLTAATSSQDRVRAHPHLSRRRRHPAVHRAGRPVRPARHARHHRWQPRPVQRYTELYRRAAQQAGTPVHPMGMHSPGFVAEIDKDAAGILYPSYKEIRDRIEALRG